MLNARVQGGQSLTPAVSSTQLGPGAAPQPLQLLGKRLVVFKNKEGDWSVLDDVCPHRSVYTVNIVNINQGCCSCLHPGLNRAMRVCSPARLTRPPARPPPRLAPLSDGRLTADGSLMCSYHGWTFDSKGSCTSVPQIADEKAQATACGSSRSCVKRYPSQVRWPAIVGWVVTLGCSDTGCPSASHTRTPPLRLTRPLAFRPARAPLGPARSAVGLRGPQRRRLADRVCQSGAHRTGGDGGGGGGRVSLGPEAGACVCVWLCVVSCAVCVMVRCAVLCRSFGGAERFGGAAAPLSQSPLSFTCSLPTKRRCPLPCRPGSSVTPPSGWTSCTKTLSIR